MTLHNRTDRRVPRSAFTLLEILIVVAIILALAGVGGFYIIGQFQESKVSNAKMMAENISKAVKQYYVDMGAWPQGLEALLSKADSGKGPWLERRDALLDPWGQMFQYNPGGTLNSQHGAVPGVIIPDVYTMTPDGRTVGNWPDPKR